MRTLIIRKGAIIYTNDGYLEVTGYNGHGIIYCNEHDYEEFINERMLTKSDIANIAHDYDGNNHMVVLDF